MQLVDIGANLTHESFRHDRAEVLARARAHGVGQIVVTGASAQGTVDAHALVLAHRGFLFATAGLHPHHASEFDADIEALLRDYLARPEVVAAGEMGLDYYRDLSPRAAQRFAFERQLELAVACGKPLFLHQREAHDDFLACLDAALGAGGRARVGAVVVHCFTGDARELDAYLARDFHIGITGWICDERRGTHLRDLVKVIPPDRLLLETDAPYLLPRNLKPMPSHRRNEPMYLAHICAEVARCRGEDVETTAANASAAARRFFALPAA